MARIGYGNTRVTCKTISQCNCHDGAAANTLSITAKIDLQRKFTATPTHIRFWSRGVGFIRELPVSGAVSFDWTPPDGDRTSRRRAAGYP